MRALATLLLAGLVVAAPGGGVLWAPGASPPPEAMHLVDLAEFAPGIILDLRYASDRNFLGRAVYPPGARALLTRGTAAKLLAASAALQAHGYALVVWDAYRPLSAAQPGRGGGRHPGPSGRTAGPDAHRL